MPGTAILAICTPCAERFPYFSLDEALQEARDYATRNQGYGVVAEVSISTCAHCGPGYVLLGRPQGRAVPHAETLVLGGYPEDARLAERIITDVLGPHVRNLDFVELGPAPWEDLGHALLYFLSRRPDPRRGIVPRLRRFLADGDLPLSAGRGSVVGAAGPAGVGGKVAGGAAARMAGADFDTEDDTTDEWLAHSASRTAYVISSLSAAGAYFGQGGTVAGARQGNVPLGQRTQPLPHDGLFIRRNNAFGTKSAVGVPELIEQSILPDQTQIRFDDFVAADPSGVPVPSDGEAIRVSYGRNAVEGRYKAHEETTHFVEIALRAAPRAPATSGASRPLAVNFIFVVDVSGSMGGEKLATVKAAIRELYARLRPDDVLGIITFDTKVRTALRATKIGDVDEAELIRTVNGLRADGGTDLNLGLLYGIDEIGRFGGDAGMLNCMYLFSDGDPTSGELDWITIRKNVAARLRGGITLSCFGFGSDARTRELDALAGLSGGHSTFVTQPDDVALTLADDVQRRDHLAAVNIQLRIDFPSDLVVWHLYGHNLVTDPSTRAAIEAEAKSIARRTRDEMGVQSLPDLITDEKGVRIFAPDLAYGETYWIVFEVQTAGTDFGTARVQYVDTAARANRHVVLDLGGVGDIDPQTVLAHGIGLWTSEITFFALDDLYENDRATAAARLQQHADLLRDVYTVVPVARLRDDWVVLDKMSSLAGTLGQSRSFADGSMQYATFVMNSFGRARSGYFRV